MYKVNRYVEMCESRVSYSKSLVEENIECSSSTRCEARYLRLKSLDLLCSKKNEKHKRPEGLLRRSRSDALVCNVSPLWSRRMSRVNGAGGCRAELSHAAGYQLRVHNRLRYLSLVSVPHGAGRPRPDQPGICRLSMLHTWSDDLRAGLCVSCCAMLGLCRLTLSFFPIIIPEEWAGRDPLSV